MRLPITIERHDDNLGLRISKRLSDDFSQIIFSIRPWVIWTRRYGTWGKAKPGRKERKEADARVLDQVLQDTGPWTVSERCPYCGHRGCDLGCRL